MTGKASNTKTTVDIIKKQRRDVKKAAGLARQTLTGFSSGQASSTVRSPVNSSSSAGSNTGNFIRSSGDTMIGPLAFYFQSKYIASGILDISQSTGAYSSRVIVIGQGGAADDLEVILGASHAGQILFFQPIQAVTLQSYLKTATAWSGSSVSYSVGDVVLDSSQRYTCHVAHTSSSATDPGSGADWETKWYRNNIRITGATERVVAIDEIILLQYDSTDGVWTVVSGGNAATGGAGLGDANVWTNVNTFQSTVSMTGPTVNLGDSTNDRVNFISQVGTDINMGTYDVINLDRLKFATSAGAGNALGTSDTGIEAQFSGGSSAGVKFQVPTNNIYQFFSGSSEKINIGSSAISLLDSVIIAGGTLAMSNNKITGLGTPTATTDAATKAYVDSSGGVSLGGTNTWTGQQTFSNQNTIIENDLTVYDNVTIQDDLQVYDDVTLGSSISDDIDIKGRVEWGNSYTASAQSYPSLALGYITIKVGGSTRNIWVS